VACPANTIGDGPNGCLCDNNNDNGAGGFWGTITATTGGYSGSCTACVVVTNAVSDATYTCTSAEDSQVSGCAHGYTENNRVGAADLCDLVACPANTGGFGPTGCTCNTGFWGTITAVAEGYSESCVACTAVENSQGAVTCTTAANSQVTACKDGYKLNEAGTAGTCEAILCPDNEYVLSNACTSCPAGTTNDSGDDASLAADTMCDPVLCAADEHVHGNRCSSCPAGMTNDSGDDASRADTMCGDQYHGTLCAVDEYVLSNKCLGCDPGTSNRVRHRDDASGEDTTCEATLCGEDEYVLANKCTSCPAGTTNDSGDDASHTDTTCDAIICDDDEYVSSNACSSCAPGTTNKGGNNDASGADTNCKATSCEKDYHVIAHTCAKCFQGWHKSAGDDAAGENTNCVENTPALLIVVVVLAVVVVALCGALGYLHQNKKNGGSEVRVASVKVVPARSLGIAETISM